MYLSPISVVVRLILDKDSQFEAVLSIVIGRDVNVELFSSWSSDTIHHIEFSSRLKLTVIHHGDGQHHQEWRWWNRRQPVTHRQHRSRM